MHIVRDILYMVVLAVSCPVWLFGLLRTGKWRKDWWGRFGWVRDGRVKGGSTSDGRTGSARGEGNGSAAGNALEHAKPQAAGGRILIHGVSVGEVNAVRLLVEQLEQRMRGAAGGSDGDEDAASRGEIIISATTNTGVTRAGQLYGARHPVVRYPLDFSFSVRRFLDAVQPDVVALVELEIWPNFVRECRRRGVPVVVVNGRLSARSFRAYRWIRRLVRSSFASLSHAGVQTQDYAERFIAMGTPSERVSVLDSMKWDNATIVEPGDVAGVDALAAAMGLDRNRPIVVAGSTGPGEEALLIEQLPGDVQLVIVPRKPERFDEVAAVMQSRDVRGTVRRTQHPDGTTRSPDGSRLFLLDTMGELRKAYALADVGIVGRSFINLFGSDPLEPVALGRPTIIGPRYGDFEDMVDALRSEGGIEVTDQPGDAVRRLVGDRAAASRLAENGRAVIRSRQGATARHVAMINRCLQEHRRA